MLALLVSRTIGLPLIAVGLVLLADKAPGYFCAAKQDRQQWFAPYYLVWYFLPGCLTMGFGAILMSISRRIVAFLVPVPRVGCLWCGYPAAGLPSGPCPECGRPTPGTSAS